MNSVCLAAGSIGIHFCRTTSGMRGTDVQNAAVVRPWKIVAACAAGTLASALTRHERSNFSSDRSPAASPSSRISSALSQFASTIPYSVRMIRWSQLVESASPRRPLTASRAAVVCGLARRSCDQTSSIARRQPWGSLPPRM